jgi:hypothetical protein
VWSTGCHSVGVPLPPLSSLQALLTVLQKTVPNQEILLFYKEAWNTPNIEVRRPRQGKGYTYAA